jgi:hypothetical protein
MVSEQPQALARLLTTRQVSLYAATMATVEIDWDAELVGLLGDLWTAQPVGVGASLPRHEISPPDSATNCVWVACDLLAITGVWVRQGENVRMVIDVDPPIWCEPGDTFKASIHLVRQ